MLICRALLKNGYSNFSLTIFEYCDSDKCLEREQHYLETLNPEYNLSKTAGAPMMGRNHSEKSRAKMSSNRSGEKHRMFGKKHSDETIKKISKALAGENNPMYGKPKPVGAGSSSVPVEVIDISL